MLIYFHFFNITGNRLSTIGNEILNILFFFITIACCLLPIALPVKAQDTIKVRTDLVVIDVQVLDKKTSEPVTGLTPSDFQIYEDGVRRDIEHFSHNKRPLSLILLIDISGSVTPALYNVRDGVQASLSHLTEKDEISIMGFSTNTQLIQDFTTDRQTVINSIASIDKISVIGRGTLLHQALVAASNHISTHGSPINSRAILCVTDNVSWDYYNYGISEKETNESILQSGATVSGLIIEGSLSSAEKIFRRDKDGKDIYRKRMTLDPFIETTGGDAIKSLPQEITTNIINLTNHLRNRYTIGFPPASESDDGSFHTLKLELTPEAKKKFGNPILKTKSGYYSKKI